MMGIAHSTGFSSRGIDIGFVIVIIGVCKSAVLCSTGFELGPFLSLEYQGLDATVFYAKLVV